MTRSPSLLRGYARVVAWLVVFAPMLAVQTDGDHRVVLLVVLAVALVAVVARCTRDESACVTALVGFAAFTALLFPSRGGVDTIEVIGPVWHAAVLAPLLFAARRGSALDTGDARDRVLLASAAGSFAALAEVVVRIAYARHHGGHYAGVAAVALGPTLLALLVVTTLGALGSLALSARGLYRWTRLRASPDVRVVPASEWAGAPPENTWWRIPGVAVDGVLVRRAGATEGAYRAGELDEALARVPRDAGAVTTWLVLRVGLAGVLLVAPAALPLVALQW